MTPSAIRKIFFDILSKTEKKVNEFVLKPGADMTRHRRCSFSDTVLAVLNFTMERSSTELFNFFTRKKQHIPSKSAFTQQRKKLTDSLFPYLMACLNESVPLKKTYKGFHLIAIDGTDINLPTDRNDNIYRVKQARSDNFYYQMHLNALYDILENRYVDAVIQPRPEMDENAALQMLADRSEIPGKTIFIADRGYVSSNSIAHLIESGNYFLIRSKAPSSPCSYIKHMMQDGVETDNVVDIGITGAKGICLKNPQVYKYLRPDRKFDFIASSDRKSVYWMRVRCTCIKIGNNSYEYLISNLPKDEFSASDLKGLYWKRWAIETSFRSLKYAFSMVYLHSVNRSLIKQEIFAKILLFNFTALLHAYAQQSMQLLRLVKSRKQQYKVSFDNAVPIAKLFLIHMMSDNKIRNLLLSHLSAIRPVTKSGRKLRSQTVRPLNTRA